MDGSPFAKLSNELRNKIYEYTFAEDITITKAQPEYESGLLRTCRKVRSEALNLFFSEAKFVLTVRNRKGGVALKWLNHLTTIKAAAITHIEVHCYGTANDAWFRRALFVNAVNAKDPYVRLLRAACDKGVNLLAIEWKATATDEAPDLGVSGVPNPKAPVFMAIANAAQFAVEMNRTTAYRCKEWERDADDGADGENGIGQDTACDWETIQQAKLAVVEAARKKFRRERP